MVNKYVVLVCGLNIRDQNRITLDEQRFALDVVANELEARPVGDKGSYAVASGHEGHRVVQASGRISKQRAGRKTTSIRSLRGLGTVQNGRSTEAFVQSGRSLLTGPSATA